MRTPFPAKVANRLVLFFLFFFSLNHIQAQDISSFTSDSLQPLLLGKIAQLDSKVLAEKRTLNIYLPEGYSSADTVHYPVIYLLDGSINEDFIHVVGLVQFYAFDWIQLVKKSIVVGIANVDRRRDFTFMSGVASDKKNNPTSGHSDKFIAFVEKELQPFIDKTFKTTHSKTLIGQSLGGLVATEILFTKPNLFSSYIIVSPSLWWNNGSLLNQKAEVLSTNYVNATNIYISVGKEGQTPTQPVRIMEEDAKALAEKLRAGNNKHLNIYFDYLPDENHATILHQALANAFKKLAGIPSKK